MSNLYWLSDVQMERLKPFFFRRSMASSGSMIAAF